MFIRFSVKNFLSFKEKETLDMTAMGTCKERVEENSFEVAGKKLLKSTVVYGANASGKTNLIYAMHFFIQFIISSSKDTTSAEEIPIVPFRLNPECLTMPSEFEIEFILDKRKYFYGFQVTRKKVVREWLLEQNKTVFIREAADDDIIQVEKKWKKAHGLEDRTRSNALFLSVCAQFAVPQAEAIINYLFSKFHVISGALSVPLKQYTCSQVHSGELRNSILDFLRNADTNIIDLTVNEREIKQSPPGQHRKLYEIRSQHNVYDSTGQVVNQVSFDFDISESLGIQKAFALAGPIIDTLNTGAVLFIDELDSRLHPIFTRQIVKLFNSSKTNPYNAQLIFNTHDTNLLSYKVYNENTGRDEYMFRRDQIYFAEKDNVEATHIYSLIEFKKENNQKIRNDASFEKDYLNGIYGAIPFIGDLLKLSDNKED